jgi:hypothetical protein
VVLLTARCFPRGDGSFGGTAVLILLDVFAVVIVLEWKSCCDILYGNRAVIFF